MNQKNYRIIPCSQKPVLDGLWESDAWLQAETVAIDYFYKESSDHHPRTAVRLIHCSDGLAGIYRIEDRYMRSISTRFHEPVYQDACVEFFVHPAGSPGYFNFEFNAGGTLLSSYVTDPTRDSSGLRASKRLDLNNCESIQIRSSMPSIIDPELAEPKTWTLQFFIPFSVMLQYTDFTLPASGSVWQGNFYKCAENNSHPHWASWQPLEGLNFHQPKGFGKLEFLG